MVFDPDWRERQEYMPETKVVNLKNEPYDVYIGRPGKGQLGYFGNRHPIGWCVRCNVEHKRGEAIAAYAKDFAKRIVEDEEFRRNVLDLKGKRLGCFCSPARCHGDIIKDWLDGQTNLS